MTTTGLGTSIPLDTVAHHGGFIRSREPLVVETDPQQWHYAVSIPVALREYVETIGLPAMVSASVTVDSGRLGCLLVGTDWATQLGKDACSVGPGQHRLDVLWERGDADGLANLVFRNDGSGGRACVFRVHAVQLTPAVPKVDGPSAQFADVVEAGGHRLDVARLHDAVRRADQIQGDAPDVFEALRRKWRVVPAGLHRRDTAELVAFSPNELREFWLSTHAEATTGEGFSARGWYHTLYRDVLHRKKVLEIGSGAGIDGIEFARHGAYWTFVDIVEGNLTVIRHLCDAFGIRDAQFLYLDSLSALDALADDYDVIWCQGSLINAPFDFIKQECAAIVRHLKPGGRWIELAYPRERWVRDGKPPFRVWGSMTDGEGTPWMEWYDLPRLLERMAPVRFAPILAMNFHGDDFNWFDLMKLGDA